MMKPKKVVVQVMRFDNFVTFAFQTFHHLVLIICLHKTVSHTSTALHNVYSSKSKTNFFLTDLNFFCNLSRFTKHTSCARVERYRSMQDVHTKKFSNPVIERNEEGEPQKNKI